MHLGDALCYARALTTLEELRQDAGVQGLAVAALGGAALLERIRRLVPAAARPGENRWDWLPAAFMALLVAVSLAAAVRVSAAAVDDDTAAPASGVAAAAPASDDAATPTSAPAHDTAPPPLSLPPEELPQTAPPLPSVAVLGVEPVGSAERLGEETAQFAALLTACLGEAPGLRLVERARLEAGMAEIGLAASGLVDNASAARVGRITGAQWLVAGKLMRMDENWTFTGRLIDTETTEAKGVRVSGARAEGLPALADAAGAVLARRLAGQERVAAGEDDEARPYAAELARLKQALAGHALPRVAVCVPESHLGTLVPDPAGENELMAVLLELGFPLVDVTTFMQREQSNWWLRLFFGTDEATGDSRLDMRQGWRNPAVILHNAKLARLKEHADIFVVGEAFSEYSGEHYGFKSAQARVELKALDTHSERIAAAASRHATAADAAEFIAGKKALRIAGGESALEIARALAEYWDKRPAPSAQ